MVRKKVEASGRGREGAADERRGGAGRIQNYPELSKTVQIVGRIHSDGAMCLSADDGSVVRSLGDVWLCVGDADSPAAHQGRRARTRKPNDDRAGERDGWMDGLS